MSYRRNNTTAATATATTHATRSTPAGQRSRSYIVNIDTGSFANVEIIVGDHHHRAGVWTTSSRAADTVKVTSNKSRHVYAYVPTSPSTPSTPTKQRTPFTPLQPQSASAARSHSSSSTSASDTWNKRATYEREDRARDYIATRQQHRLATDERSRARQREREDEARRRQRFAEAEAEAEARRAAAAKEARRRQRLAEQQRHEEQKRQQQQQRALREHTRRGREIANAWGSYETRWGQLSQSQSQRQLGGGGPSSLTFERIPWPVADSEVIPPPLDDGRRHTRTRRRALDELLRPEAIREFLLSPAHSAEVSSKDRIRTALRRWHPDKFARVLGLVVESDKDDVADGVGIVVRCLNEMLERENQA